MTTKDSKNNSSSTSSSKSETKVDSTSTESPTSESKPASSGGFTRGERQKVVTDSYRDSWDHIFTKKRKH